MKTPHPDRIPKQDPVNPNDDPGQRNPRPPGSDNPSDNPRPGTDPGNPYS